MSYRGDRLTLSTCRTKRSSTSQNQCSYSRKPKQQNDCDQYSRTVPAGTTNQFAPAVDNSGNSICEPHRKHIVKLAHARRCRRSAIMEDADAVTDDFVRDTIRDELGPDVELDDEDCLGDQVMHIRAPAAPVKDVSKVRKDLYHNRSDLQHSGLTRAISGIVGGDRIRVVKQQEEVMFAYSPSQTNTGREVNVAAHLMRNAVTADRSRISNQNVIRPTTGALMRSISSMSVNKRRESGSMIRSISSLGLGKNKAKTNQSKSLSSNSSHSRSSSDCKSLSKEKQSFRKPRKRSLAENQGPPIHSPVKLNSGISVPQRRVSLLKRSGRSMRNSTASSLSVTTGTLQSDVVRDDVHGFPDISPVSVASTPAKTPNSAFSNKERKISTRNSFRASVRAIGFSRMLLKKAVDSKENSPTSGVNNESEVADWPVNNVSVMSPEKGKIVVEPLTPEKLDGRGNNFFFSEVRSEKIQASGLLQEDGKRIRVPVLTLAEYSGPVSKSRWFVDAFTLPHNAVRRECMDLYDLIIGIARLCAPDDVMSDDISSFYDWWEVCSRFIRCYFEVERKVMIPWVDKVSSKADGQVKMAMRKMRGMKETLKVQLSQVDEAWVNRDEQSAAETYGRVYNAVDAFVPRLMNYLADQEILLPAIVRDHYTIEDRMKMDKELIAEFIKSDSNNSSGSNHNIILLSRWMTNPRQLRAFINKYLPTSSRNTYPKWIELFESEHHRYVESIKHRTSIDD